MKIVKVVFLALLFVSLFVFIDLGLNLLGLSVPEIQDGIAYNSILQSQFGLLEEAGINTSADFFYAFCVSAWISFAVLAGNVLLFFIASKKRKQQSS